MKIIARVQNSRGKNDVILQTNADVHSLTIPPKSTGLGSHANGGELMFLALATCYCNDIYREAEERGIKVAAVEVTVEGDFGGQGEPATNVSYNARVSARATEDDIRDLMKHTDTVAEIQNTLRSGTAVALGRIEAKSV